MKVIHVASELAPIAKVGGIGDVLLGLCCASISLGIDVEVVLPFYSQINKGLLPDLNHIDTQFFLYNKEKTPCKIWQATLAGIPITLLDIVSPIQPFNRPGIYGEEDDSVRFSLFTLAAAKYLESQLFSALHLHDWHSASLPYCLKKNAPNILSIHNIAYQGFTSEKTLEAMHLPLEPFFLNGSYSLLKGGIEYADSLVAVSPSYAQEILSPPNDCGLGFILQKNKGKLCGILNGIDYDYWNPQSDSHLKVHFSKDDPSNKTLIKQQLLDSLGLQHPDRPLFAAIARLVPQKGPDLICAAFEKALKEGSSCILLADSKDSTMCGPFKELKKRYPYQVQLEFRFNEELSHLVFAASDVILVPSLFEPCGLTQMIAMRYGALPLVRSTGGLKDTVDEQTGFVFEPTSKEAIQEQVSKALSMWDEHPKTWQKMRRAGMHKDFSWGQPAKKYAALYKQLCSQYQSTLF